MEAENWIMPPPPDNTKEIRLEHDSSNLPQIESS
jgi:hypothetical protein